MEIYDGWMPDLFDAHEAHSFSQGRTTNPDWDKAVATFREPSEEPTHLLALIGVSDWSPSVAPGHGASPKTEGLRDGALDPVPGFDQSLGRADLRS